MTKQSQAEQSWALMSVMWQLVRDAVYETEPLLAEHKLSAKEFFVLGSIRYAKTPTAISKATAIAPSMISYMLGKLEKRGLLKREADAADLRRFTLTLTKKGEQIVVIGQKAMGEAFSEQLDYKNIPKQQRKILIQLLGE